MMGRMGWTSWIKLRTRMCVRSVSGYRIGIRADFFSASVIGVKAFARKDSRVYISVSLT